EPGRKDCTEKRGLASSERYLYLFLRLRCRDRIDWDCRFIRDMVSKNRFLGWSIDFRNVLCNPFFSVDDTGGICSQSRRGFSYTAIWLPLPVRCRSSRIEGYNYDGRWFDRCFR